MSFSEKVRAIDEINDCLRSGLQALGGNSTVVVTANSRDCQGSVDFDDCLQHRYPDTARWDYLIGYAGRAYFVEVHPATTRNVSEVINKLCWPLAENHRDDAARHPRRGAVSLGGQRQSGDPAEQPAGAATGGGWAVAAEAAGSSAMKVPDRSSLAPDSTPPNRPLSVPVALMVGFVAGSSPTLPDLKARRRHHRADYPRQPGNPAPPAGLRCFPDVFLAQRHCLRLPKSR